MCTSAVHCEGLGGGEHGEDPKEEARPGGEDVRLGQHGQENLSDRRHQSSVGDVDVQLIKDICTYFMC